MKHSVNVHQHLMKLSVVSKKVIVFLMLSTIIFSCKPKDETRKPIQQVTVENNPSEMKKNLDKYVSVKLTAF